MVRHDPEFYQSLVELLGEIASTPDLHKVRNVQHGMLICRPAWTAVEQTVGNRKQPVDLHTISSRFITAAARMFAVGLAVRALYHDEQKLLREARQPVKMPVSVPHPSTIHLSREEPDEQDDTDGD